MKWWECQSNALWMCWESVRGVLESMRIAIRDPELIEKADRSGFDLAVPGAETREGRIVIAETGEAWFAISGRWEIPADPKDPDQEWTKATMELWVAFKHQLSFYKVYEGGLEEAECIFCRSNLGYRHPVWDPEPPLCSDGECPRRMLESPIVVLGWRDFFIQDPPGPPISELVVRLYGGTAQSRYPAPRRVSQEEFETQWAKVRAMKFDGGEVQIVTATHVVRVVRYENLWGEFEALEGEKFGIPNWAK